MDLDDSFTERLLARSKARKEYLKGKMGESPGRKKRTALVDEQQIPNKGGAMTKESPKRLRVDRNEETKENTMKQEEYNSEREEHCSMEEDNVSAEEEESKENISMEKEVPIKARGLAALRKKESTQDVVHNGNTYNENSEVSKPATYLFSTNGTELCSDRKTRLANLAADINGWEDNLQRSNVPQSSKTLQTNVFSINTKSVNTKENLVAKVAEKFSEPPKAVKGTKALGKEVKIPTKEEKSVKPIIKDFISKEVESTLNRSFEPSKLPLSARKALFEKAMTGGSTQSISQTIEPKLSVAQRAAMFENASRNIAGPRAVQKQINASPVKQCAKTNVQSPIKSTANGNFVSPVKSSAKFVFESPKQKEERPVVFKQSSVEKPVVKTSFSPNQHAVQPQPIECVSKEPERKREISNLVSHWEKLSSSSATTSQSEEDCSAQLPTVSESASYTSEEEEEEEEEEIDPTELEPEEPAESESDLSEQNQSIADEESYKESEEEDPFVEPAPFNPRQFSVEAGLDMDSLPPTDDETQSSMTDQYSIKSSVSDGSSCYPSQSQSYSSTSSCGTEEGVERLDVPLQYTVSFYRKQKQETRTPPVRTIVRREQITPIQEDEKERTQEIQDRIKQLQEEIIRQQTVIGQTSQALNLCHTTAEFSGSSEQVEGERLLLIATQKRQAILNEIQRLKSHGAQGSTTEEGTGTLTITGMELPLKRDFIAAQLEGKTNDVVHYFLCLLRHGHQVVVTQMVSTNDKITDGSLHFSNLIQLKNLPSDFSVVFEVYTLQTKKENLPHDKKYHIKREHSKIRLTPKGKKADGKLPALSSPGGPHAVRSPSFSVVGYTRFSLHNCSKKCFTLDKIPFTSPLEGVLKVRLQLHAKHKITEKGFLTMFEDVSGFGAWHRRWCALDGNILAYWKYPDQENKKDAMGAIDLRQCVTKEVRVVSRDVCARPHTFLLMEVRPRREGEKDTLISQSQNTLTTTRRLLSADTKEERERWCQRLNEALQNVRKWDPHALAPTQ
ncbi:anillin [Nephila pilipes]|uniref:Anillin n=1 Tax=Nephila pilipes TaxID=299642 RepID=A0A8X6N0G2_NEPPI|nr:anillin [Nephila pilipes]